MVAFYIITNHVVHNALGWLLILMLNANSFRNHFTFVEEERFELAIINPALVLGPVICTATTSHSIEVRSFLYSFNSICPIIFVEILRFDFIFYQKIAKKLMERGIPAVPKMYFYVGDVRDVAQAHIKATIVPEAAGKSN